MVRVKERYLLVSILYPAEQAKGNVPDLVVYNQPTTDSLSPEALSRAIRAEIKSLFGDYGAGSVGKSLLGERDLPSSSCLPKLISISSKIPV